MQIVSIAALAKPTVSPLKEVGAVAPKSDSRAAASDPRKEMAEFAAPPPSSAGERPGAHGEAFARLLRQAQAAARQDAAMPYAQETMPPAGSLLHVAV
ncbi:MULTISPECIES: hypothetical protein [Chromobacterium]|uniref:Flagellar hook-length control protein FliK n=1 Tax=Chromobacterium aquaticum TaxID=467180 RepID=A0ABV8ZQW3_9NEIS|nr:MULTISPECIES: hypothetical protein [Chromobacterium]KMN36066.1 hypothetical protein VI26_08385 [Chromobacterium sp. LK1]MCD5360363.1 hypothetical protein [Chromobacterium aquaticum]